MNHNWKVIRNKCYGILKSPGKDVKNLVMYDEKGNETVDPLESTRMFVELSSKDPNIDSYKILVAIRDDGQASHIEIKTPNLVNDKDFDQVHRLVNHIKGAIGRKEGIKITWQQLDKEINTREEAMHNIQESKDVGKLSGTTKSSFQRIGEAKLIIRHTDTVNEDKHGARTRHIRALFVENKLGERFAYPHLHMTGARAFARHISNGGTNYDTVAEKLFKLSEDYLSLRRAAKQIRLHESANSYVNPIRKCMEGINKKLKSMHGPKGYATMSKDLLKENTITDLAAIEKLHLQIAESCACQQGGEYWDDYGTAAQYISQHPQPTVVNFTWSRKPEFTNSVDSNLASRMHNQILELADACTNEEAAMKLREVAQMLIDGTAPEQSHMDFVKEALASSMKFVPENMHIPEEAELDEYLSEYELENIFVDEDQAKNSIDALVAAGVKPSDATEEVEDIQEEHQDTFPLGMIPEYGGILIKSGPYMLTVKDGSNQDGMMKSYAIVKDNGPDQDVEHVESPSVNPADSTDYEAIEYFKGKYGEDEPVLQTDEGIVDTLKQAGREFWHGTPPENEAERVTRQKFAQHQLQKDVASGKVRILDPKTGKPIDPVTGEILDNGVKEQLDRLSKLAGI